jgi:phenylacetic acid degradation operon negative regulatory protein
VTKSRNDALGLRPFTARSVMLSVLLGTNPPRLPVAKLVAVAELFGISEGAARTAPHAAAATSAWRSRYRLSPRLVERQRRQEQSRSTPVPWNGRGASPHQPVAAPPPSGPPCAAMLEQHR